MPNVSPGWVKRSDRGVVHYKEGQTVRKEFTGVQEGGMLKITYVWYKWDGLNSGRWWLWESERSKCPQWQWSWMLLKEGLNSNSNLSPTATSIGLRLWALTTFSVRLVLPASGWLWLGLSLISTLKYRCQTAVLVSSVLPEILLLDCGIGALNAPGNTAVKGALNSPSTALEIVTFTSNAFVKPWDSPWLVRVHQSIACSQNMLTSVLELTSR